MSVFTMRSLYTALALGFVIGCGSVEAVCRTSPCCEGTADGGPHTNGKYQCDRLIPQNSYSVAAGGRQRMECDSGSADATGACTWTAPSGRDCRYTTSGSRLSWTGDLCGSLQLIGAVNNSVCTVEIISAMDNRDYNGIWNCSVEVGKGYTDHVNVTVGLSTAAVLGISIPISVVAVAVLVVVLICCLCPAYCACCSALICCRSLRDRVDNANNNNVNNAKTRDARDGAVQTKAPSKFKRPRVRYEHESTVSSFSGGGNNRHYDVAEASEDSSSDGFAQDTANGNYEQVVYTHAGPTQVTLGGVDQQRTARKISNAVSIHSFGQKNKGKKTSVPY